MMRKYIGLLVCLVLAAVWTQPVESADAEFPGVLGIKERSAVQNNITQMRLNSLLPDVMTETGFDMWIILCNEDNLDPVFKTMAPYDTWAPITQILVLYQASAGSPVERLNVSRTDMKGLHKDAWDHRAWDNDKTESQWNCLARLIEERRPRRIGINESDVIWASDNLTVSLKKKLVETIGPEYSKRLFSAEALTTLWLETLLDEELELYERANGIAHALMKEIFSAKAVTPGVTTLDDLLWYYLQRVADLGLKPYGWPWFRIRGRDPDILEKYGAEDRVIRRGDLIQCDAGIVYLRYHTDHSEWAYVLRPNETDVPAGFKAVMAEGNRLQDIFCQEFKLGLTGNELLNNILATAKEKGICKPKIYSHAIGYFLHEPGPLIGLPWEQKDTVGRGEVKLVYNSTFTAELSVTCPGPEWEGKELRMALEQVVAFTPEGTYFIDGRQTEFYIIQ